MQGSNGVFLFRFFIILKKWKEELNNVARGIGDFCFSFLLLILSTHSATCLRNSR